MFVFFVYFVTFKRYVLQVGGKCAGTKHTNYTNLLSRCIDTSPAPLSRRTFNAWRFLAVLGLAMMAEFAHWLWPGWIPQGHLSLLCGLPGAQTALVAAWLATTVLRGGALPDGALLGPDKGRQVMWIDSAGEDRARAHFKALGAPLDRVFGPYDPERPKAAVDLADDRWLGIVTDLAHVERPCWVIVDGLGVLHSHSLEHALDVMADVARDVGCAATFLCDQAGRGPLAPITRKVATAMVLDRWGPTTADMRFRVIESKLGAIPGSLRLRIKDGIPEVDWTPTMTRKTVVDCAVAYLERELAAGPQPALGLTEAAKLEGISKRSLERAKRLLGVRTYQSAGRWWWASA